MRILLGDIILMTVKELIKMLQNFPEDSIVSIPSMDYGHDPSEGIEEMEAQNVIKNEFDDGPIIC